MTDQPKHTPGPWHRNIKPATHYTTVWSGRNTHVARVVPEGLTEAEVEANINLIAAAPDLLDALERLLAERADSDAHGRPSHYAWEQAEAAIVKATGQ